MLKFGHVVVLLFRNVEGWSCSSFVVKKCLKVGSCSSSCCKEMLKVGHVVVLLLRNVEGWSCSSFAGKKCCR